jgi:hypothetical protein
MLTSSQQHAEVPLAIQIRLCISAVRSMISVGQAMLGVELVVNQSMAYVIPNPPQ